MDRKTLETAAAAANMSVRSARTWRTRKDPFTEVWERELVPLLLADRNGVLEATTLMQVIDEKHPGRFGAGQVRTLQRRLRDWRALNGGEREVFFEQRHVPGREGAFDFTHATELGVTIAGALYPHLLFHFVLSFSGWTYVTLALSETYEALLDGLQGALWALGGVPEVVRSDNLSAATHELAESKGRALDDRFAAVLAHYGMRSTRIAPGRSHENGVVESANGRIKTVLEHRRPHTQPRHREGSRGGAASSSTAAVVSRADVHDLSSRRPPVEHRSRRRQDLLGSIAPDRLRGRGSSPSRRRRATTATSS